MMRLGRYVLGSVFVGYGTLHILGRQAGSTAQERRRRMPGDELVARPQILTNHAITVEARPADVWPWLTQMGWHLGGYYAPEWVDRLLFPQNWPSLDRLDPVLQRDLKVGDTIPDGPPGTAEFVVAEVDAPHTLVLHSTTHLPPHWRERFGADLAWTWSFRLAELPGRRYPAAAASPGPNGAVVADRDLTRRDRPSRLRHGWRDAARGQATRRIRCSAEVVRQVTTGPGSIDPMKLWEQILGVGMRRGFQARVDQLNPPTGPGDAPGVARRPLSNSDRWAAAGCMQSSAPPANSRGSGVHDCIDDHGGGWLRWPSVILRDTRSLRSDLSSAGLRARMAGTARLSRGLVVKAHARRVPDGIAVVMIVCQLTKITGVPVDGETLPVVSVGCRSGPNPSAATGCLGTRCGRTRHWMRNR